MSEGTFVFQFGQELSIPFNDAIERTVAFASIEDSGFLTYDLAGSVARAQHQLAQIGPWTILLATTLGVSVRGKAVRSMAGSVAKFATLVQAVPCGKDLHTLTDAESQSVKAFCRFRVLHVRTAIATKLGALYRPRAIPIVDSTLASVYGKASDQVVDGLAGDIRRQLPQLRAAHAEATSLAPDLAYVSLLRFCDIAIWTTMDDQGIEDANRRWLAIPQPAVPISRRESVRYYLVDEDPPLC